MNPFKLILTDGARSGTISLHMIGPKEMRALELLADTCAPSLSDPGEDVLKTMLTLGAIAAYENGYGLTDLGRAIVQLKAFQPH
jgi:hypothetical protein